MTTAIERALYRGRRVGTGEWVEGHYAGLTVDKKTAVLAGTTNGQYYTDGIVHIDPATVGQWTGEIDNNKQRIFFGDRCTVAGDDYYSNGQFNIEPDREDIMWELNGVVRFDSAMWVVEFNDYTCIPFCDIITDGLDITITGTIHDREAAK